MAWVLLSSEGYDPGGFRAACFFLVDHGLSPLWQEQVGWLIKNRGRRVPAFPDGVADNEAWPALHPT